MIAKLKSSGVTSVLLAGDPVFPTLPHNRGDQAGLLPRVGRPRLRVHRHRGVRSAATTRQQWAHAFGVSLLPARTADDVDELANLITWQTGQPARGEDLPRARAGAPGVLHRRAPRRARASPPRRSAAGLSASRPTHTTTPTRLHLSWGRHGIWKGVDLTGGDDATVIWWDPNAAGTDEVGRDGKGLYRYADDGRRYLPGQWPKPPVGRSTPTTSTTVLTTLPPGRRAAELPVAGRFLTRSPGSRSSGRVPSPRELVGARPSPSPRRPRSDGPPAPGCRPRR